MFPVNFVTYVPGCTCPMRRIIAAGAEMNLEFTAVFRKVPQGYIGFVEELPGANTQGATLEETRANLKEAIAFVLQANRTLAQEDASGPDVIRERLNVTA